MSLAAMNPTASYSDIDYRSTAGPNGCTVTERQRQSCSSGGGPHTRLGVRAASLGLPIFQNQVCRDDLNTSGCGPKKFFGKCVKDHIYTIDDFKRPGYKCGRAVRDPTNILPRPLPAGCRDCKQHRKH